MGNGIYTNAELVGSLINDLNELLKFQSVGQHLQAAAVVTGMVQKLANLQKNIDNDLKNRDEIIDDLKARLRACGQEVIEVPADEYAKELKNE